ncbi:hypothetical protein BaRGS_00007322 [Batillaria attramentaria]|uniref:Uncharacterized protein n=1 Tax=Batillaria attramentaria TaxID=370345 RepID=A0ABD0LPV7_9CAEN
MHIITDVSSIKVLIKTAKIDLPHEGSEPVRIRPHAKTRGSEPVQTQLQFTVRHKGQIQPHTKTQGAEPVQVQPHSKRKAMNRFRYIPHKDARL